MFYHSLRTVGAVPRDQLGLNVKIWIEAPVTVFYRRLDDRIRPNLSNDSR